MATSIDKVTKIAAPTDNHFKYIFWFIAFVTAFGMFLSVFVILVFPKDMAGRFADVALIFWLSTAVSGGIGYLIGSSVNKQPAKEQAPGTTTADISATITTEPINEKK